MANSPDVETGREASIRWGWLKAMYIYTLVGAGGFGVMTLFLPSAARTLFRLPEGDPAVLGLYGSFSLAVALLSVLALRSPLKFLPLLLIQLVYKPIWLIVFALPIFLKGRFPMYVVIMSAVYASYIVGNLIAIPFSYLFPRKATND
jgi:hypothetical protein